jgi:hypothetical protein
MGKTTQDHHNEGESDRADGNGYNRPHSHTEEFFTWSSDSVKEVNSDNSAYQKGWNNADKQDK